MSISRVVVRGFGFSIPAIVSRGFVPAEDDVGGGPPDTLEDPRDVIQCRLEVTESVNCNMRLQDRNYLNCRLIDGPVYTSMRVFLND